MKEITIDAKGNQTIIELIPDLSNADAIALNYEDLVDSKIRAKYSVSEEFAILRQKEDKPVEYTEYYNYCEQCKSEAKLELGL